MKSKVQKLTSLNSQRRRKGITKEMAAHSYSITISKQRQDKGKKMAWWMIRWLGEG